MAAVLLFVLLLGIIAVWYLNARSAPEQGATTADVVIHPQRYIGEEVTLAAPVVELPAAGLFFLFAQAPAGDLLVAVPAEAEEAREALAAVTPGDAVVVEGSVTNLADADIGAITGDPDLDLEALPNEVVVIAESVVRLAGDRIDEMAINVSIRDILAQPEEHAGRLVRVTGSIGDVVSENAVTVVPPDGGPGLLVVGRDPLARVSDRDDVSFVGLVQAFDVRSFERALFTELEDDRYGAWEDSPALLLQTREAG